MKQIKFNCGCLGEIRTLSTADNMTSVRINKNCKKHHDAGRTADDQLVAEIVHLRAELQMHNIAIAGYEISNKRQGETILDQHSALAKKDEIIKDRDATIDRLRKEKIFPPPGHDDGLAGRRGDD